ncbi:MAG TPA: hypothetical protein PKW63_11855 [Vicinamibacterales bacterium]|jgi:hypothetical protein|nr:hypothetical protein [Acidobacteriota bacterium]HQX82446.1 hypothetical protein [Vicinamibacterales bacterium]
MLESLAAIVIDSGLQTVGWAVMKAVTFGRYRGFQPEDILFEGTLGFVTLVAVGYGVYRLIF